jgi:BlaI family transcriptional regulator, penicillinase repressor
MRGKIAISDAEWKVMKELWRKSPQGAYELAEALRQTEDWDQRTVKTLLARLVKKGAVTYQRYKNLYLYRPILTQEESIEPKLRNFLDQVFDGSLPSLLLHFSRRAKLSKTEMKEIKQIIRNMEA